MTMTLKSVSRSPRALTNCPDPPSALKDCAHSNQRTKEPACMWRLTTSYLSRFFCMIGSAFTASIMSNACVCSWSGARFARAFRKPMARTRSLRMDIVVQRGSNRGSRARSPFKYGSYRTGTRHVYGILTSEAGESGQGEWRPNLRLPPRASGFTSHSH